ncbi:MAG: GntR family transcriptional regulator [Desulfobacterales bacterium]|nr:GntR family transcriptional regulator [Desulfobacterales bacterium]
MVKHKSITERVTAHIRRNIICGFLPAGFKLNETELAEQMGISRPPLRETFRKLEHENLVVNMPRKGVHVSPVSVQDAEQIYFIRQCLECSAVDILREKNDSDLSPLAASIAESEFASLSKATSVEDMYRYYKTMAGFHFALIDAAKNSWLVHVYRSIASTLARYQVMYLRKPDISRSSNLEHMKILRHLQSGSFSDAKEELKAHIQRTVRDILSKMTDRSSPPAAGKMAMTGV